MNTRTHGNRVLKHDNFKKDKFLIRQHLYSVYYIYQKFDIFYMGQICNFVLSCRLDSIILIQSGMDLYLDSFNKHVSNLTYLSNFPVSILKDLVHGRGGASTLRL